MGNRDPGQHFLV
jgi:hypothetical protein